MPIMSCNVVDSVVIVRNSWCDIIAIVTMLLIPMPTTSCRMVACVAARDVPVRTHVRPYLKGGINVITQTSLD